MRCFIGSTKERLGVAETLSVSLEQVCQPVVWNQDRSSPSQLAIESIEKEFLEYDFFIFVASADDITISRKSKKPSVRDNIIFEIGYAMGIVGRQNVVLVCPELVSAIRLPTDIIGLNVTTFSEDRFKENEMAALTKATREIKRLLASNKALGAFRNNAFLNKYGIRQGNASSAEVLRYFEKLGDAIVAKGVIRTDWNILVSIDSSHVSEGIIKELLTSSYTLRNVQAKTIEYPFKFFDHSDETLGLHFSITKDAEGGEVLLERESRDAKGGLRKREAKIAIGEGESIKIVVNYELSHYVNPQRVHFHNSYVTTNPTDNIVMTVDLPDDYNVDVLAEDLVKSSAMSNRHVFRISGPILPESCIEYIVWKNT